jgi:ubiquinone/menaquinone biosynthesis C-methylase UbiE
MVNLEQIREGWDRYAAAYDEAITPFSMRVAEDALSVADVRPGMKLLDIAAGGGALSIPAARLGAEVLAADFSPVMVELLNRKALEQGLSNLEARVMDGNALELNDGAFDVSCSQWGIMLFPDRRKALQEMARVTRPGGKGVMVVFGPPQRVQIFSLFFQALSTAIPTFTPPQNSPLFSLQDPQNLRREMEEAGFSDVQVETQEHPFEVQSGDHLWSIMQFSAPATAGLLQQFTSEQQVAARATLDDLLRAEYGDGPAQLAIATHVGVGVK